jgi:hypothetical protein
VRVEYLTTQISLEGCYPSCGPARPRTPG